ncbi:lactoylglutathione lyase [Pontibacillus chungwhensis BH030062]|uniref:Lactoylglutathione lyase n=2 Tax=Pontibacillus chungwhensis TaxID=265426 RepID=A0A0A2UV29_9BACI|nr:lactoylglutathione lyase [Pontibacillus chungwhensis BH030062]
MEYYVKDIEASLEFYENLVGLELYGRNERAARFNYDCFSLLLTSEQILNKKEKERTYFDQNGMAQGKGNGAEMIIVVDRLEVVYERFLHVDYPVVVGIQTYPWGMRGFKVADPDGNLIRITSE